jgi:hypothetical protein
MKTIPDGFFDEASLSKAPSPSLVSQLKQWGIESHPGDEKEKKVVLDLAWMIDFFIELHGSEDEGIFKGTMRRDLLNSWMELIARWNDMIIPPFFREPTRGGDSPWVALGADLFMPSRSVTITVIDNSTSSIIWTLKALAGAPNVKFRVFMQEHPSTEAEANPEKWFNNAAQKIVADKPDIILLSHGFGGLEFKDLMGFIRRSSPKEIVFVANTGGDPARLMSRGALSNCDKGRHLEPVNQALEMVEGMRTEK